MKKFFISILKYIKTLLVVLIIISAVVFIISIIFKYKLSNIFSYAALVCMIIGGSSLSGNINMTSDPKYFLAESASSKSLYQSSRDNLKLRDSSYSFLIFMVIIGLLLITISSILRRISF